MNSIKPSIKALYVSTQIYNLYEIYTVAKFLTSKEGRTIKEEQIDKMKEAGKEDEKCRLQLHKIELN